MARRCIKLGPAAFGQPSQRFKGTRSMQLKFLLATAAAAMLASPAMAVTIDFSTDDGGNALTDGQSISTFARPDNVGPAVPFSSDTVLEFGNVVNVSSSIIGSDGHLGAAVFDSSIGGPNDGGIDDDLVVDQGNILILQNDASPATTLDATFGLVFDTPNDERDFNDRGAIIFDFLSPVELLSIDLVDINGGNNVVLTLTDGGGLTRTYDVDSNFTGGKAVDTLDLTTLAAQLGIGGGSATASEDGGFDPLDARQLSVAFLGGPTSGGLDNVSFNVVPVPPALLLFGSALLWMGGWRKLRGSA